MFSHCHRSSIALNMNLFDALSCDGGPKYVRLEELRCGGCRCENELEDAEIGVDEEKMKEHCERVLFRCQDCGVEE